jgi:hypothetical protein
VKAPLALMTLSNAALGKATLARESAPRVPLLWESNRKLHAKPALRHRMHGKLISSLAAAARSVTDFVEKPTRHLSRRERSDS